MSKKRRGGLVLLSVALVAIVVGCGGREPPSVNAILTKWGYLAITPPSKLHRPGTINTVEFINGGKVALHPTCDVDPKLLKGKIEESPTTEGIKSRKLNEKLEMAGDLSEIFTSKANIELIEDVLLKLNNPSILVVSDQTLVSIQKAILKGTCQEAVEQNLNNGGRVCQTREVLKADIVYEIKYKKNVSMEIQDQLTSKAAANLQKVAANFNITFTQDGANRISARDQLFYGIKLMPQAIIINKPGAKLAQCPKLDLTSTSQY